jgi:hypothetical protein
VPCFSYPQGNEQPDAEGIPVHDERARRDEEHERNAEYDDVEADEENER